MAFPVIASSSTFVGTPQAHTFDIPFPAGTIDGDVVVVGLAFSLSVSSILSGANSNWDSVFHSIGNVGVILGSTYVRGGDTEVTVTFGVANLRACAAVVARIPAAGYTDDDPFTIITTADFDTVRGYEQENGTTDFIANPTAIDFDSAGWGLAGPADVMWFEAIATYGNDGANGGSESSALAVAPAGWTLLDEEVADSGAGWENRVGLLYHTETTDSVTMPAWTIGASRHLMEGGPIALVSYAPAEQAFDVLSTVATIDHDLLIGVEKDQHHTEIHALQSHTGGLLYKTGAAVTISDADFTAPVDGMMAVTYDSTTGITLVWTRLASTWDAMETTI